MADAAHDQRDFFVSFNKADRAWAEWIAWILEEAGHSVLFQHWDFKGNFVLEMDRAHKQTRRTIAVLSPDYLTSAFTAPEWAARFAEDARSEHDLLIPIRVRECDLSGLLAQIVYVDLIGTSRSQARQSLLDRVAGIRPKPKDEPLFPGDPLPQAARSFNTEPPFPIAVNNLPAANPDFVGREGVLAELRSLLTAGQGPAVLTQAITGLGGIGKTQTARAYAYRHLADYELIWWLRAETSATLAADYATLAAPLGLDPETADQAKLTAVILQRLQSTSGWLLIFDNVEDPTLPRAWLPGTGGGHALITSRRTDWYGVAKALSLELMPEDEALRLLTGSSDPQTLAPTELGAARKLAAELGRLPLALAQARAYMVETGKSLAAYLRLFHASRPADFAAGMPSRDYQASFATTWQISIEAATAACPAARPLLDLLAFLAPDPLPIEVLGTNPEALPPALRGEHARDDAIAALRRYSLVEAEADSLTIHRLVQSITREALEGRMTRICAKVALHIACAPLASVPDEYMDRHKISSLLPHVLVAVEWAELLNTDLDVAAWALNRTGLYFLSHAAFADAEDHLGRAARLDQKIHGPYHHNTAATLSNLASVYQTAGRYLDALDLRERVVAIGEQLMEEHNPARLVWLQNLGSLYRTLHRFEDAEPILVKVVSLSDERTSSNALALAKRLNNLAGLYEDTDRHADAEPLYQRAIAIGKNILPPDHPDLAVWLNNLGGLYNGIGRCAEAESLCRRALQIRENVLGPAHPQTAQSLANLAAILIRLDRHAEAEPLCRRAIGILEATLPPTHPDIATARANYEALLALLDRSGDAQPSD